MKYKNYILLLCFCCVPVILLAQTGNIIYNVGQKSIQLRWQGIHNINHNGYIIYRQTDQSGAWDKMNNKEILPEFNNAKLQIILGYKLPSYLQLFGINDTKTSLSTSIWQSTFSAKGAEPLIGAMSMVNPEYGKALGETFEDINVLANTKYQYKVVYLLDGVEKELALSNVINFNNKTVVPAIKSVNTKVNNESINLCWKKDNAALKNAEFTTYRVYMAKDLLGPYELLNYFGNISFSIQSGEKKSTDSICFNAEFLENGIQYYFQIRNVNAFGIESTPSPTVSGIPRAAIADGGNLEAKLQGSQLKLCWNGSKRTAIYRAKNKLPFEKVYPPADVVLAPTTCWFDAEIMENNSYSYYAKNMDENGLEGRAGDTLHWFYYDKTAPQAPKNVKITAQKGILKLSWDENKEKDILGYEIERASDVQFFTRFLITSKPIKNTFYIDSLNYLSQTNFGYLVYAVDKDYNRSAPSTIAYGKMPDFDPPTAPRIIKLYETDSGVHIAWTKALEKDVKQYRILRKKVGDISWITVKDITNTYYHDLNVIASAVEYGIISIDSAGNKSPISAVQKITVLADRSTRTPINATIKEKEGQIVLTWQAATGSNPEGFVITRIVNNAKLDVAQLGGKENTFTDLYPVNGKIIYEIRARNKEWQLGKPAVLIIER